MGEQRHRILVVSGRLLMAQGIVSLLENAPNIEQIEVIDNLYDALAYCRHSPPDAMVIDLPFGADYFVDRPVNIEGREIKTIVLLEDEESGQAHLYVHTPHRVANLQNLLWAIQLDGGAIAEEPADACTN